MTYRIYRRDPVTKGSWYLAVKCKGCGRFIFLLDDTSDGKMPVLLAGDGQVSSPCLRCAHEDLYSVNDLLRVRSEENIDSSYPPRVRVSTASCKPLWKAYPKAKVTFGVGFIEDRPVAAAIVGRIITSWADIEIQCARLLAEMLGTDIPAAAAVFSSLRSSRAQYDALAAAAGAVLNERDLELFEAHMARRASLEKVRNDLAHGCFGVSVAIPDHIVWVAQADYIEFFTNNRDSESFRKRLFVYELGTIERIAQEITEYHTQLGFFIGYLYARRDGSRGSSFRDLRYPQLCIQPHIRQALERARAKNRQKL